MQDPDTIDQVPMSFYDLMISKDYWLYGGSTVSHDGKKQYLSISTYEGNSIGCCITRGGDLEIYINGQKRAVGWRNVPVDKPLWGVVDMYADGITIQSEFYCGELYSYNIYSVSHSCACACMYISTCSLHIISKPVKTRFSVESTHLISLVSFIDRF